MNELPTIWQKLPTHQKIKYIAELIAIFCGVFLLILNSYQLKLLAQQNAINYEILKSTFPLEIDSDLIDYTDGEPIVLRVKIGNIVSQTLYLQIFIPKYVLSGSNIIKSGLSEIETKIYKQDTTNMYSSPYIKGNDIVLKPYESCVLELTTSLRTNIYHKKNMVKYSPELASFIVIPITLRSPEQQTSRTLLVSLARDENKTLLISSEISRITDDKMLLEEVKYRRISVGFMMRNPADLPEK